MAFADFVVTDFGAQWIAQSVADAQQGTQLAVLTSMDFGLADASTPPQMDVVWCSDTTSLAVTAGSGHISIRGVASNIGDTVAHQFDFIEIDGLIGATPGVIAYCKSAETETIPPAADQQITRVATVSLAVSGTATVTLSTPQTGYAIEEEVAKIAPAVNVGGIKLGDGAGHTVTLDCDSSSNLTISERLMCAKSINANDNITGSGALTVLGDITSSLGNVIADGNVSAGEDVVATGDLIVGGNAAIVGVIGSNSARLMAYNAPSTAVYDGATYTVVSAGGAKTSGVAREDVISSLGLSGRSGTLIVIYSDGTVAVGFISSGTPTIGVSGGARLVLAYLA